VRGKNESITVYPMPDMMANFTDNFSSADADTEDFFVYVIKFDQFMLHTLAQLENFSAYEGILYHVVDAD